MRIKVDEEEAAVGSKEMETENIKEEEAERSMEMGTQNREKVETGVKEKDTVHTISTVSGRCGAGGRKRV